MLYFCSMKKIEQLKIGEIYFPSGVTEEEKKLALKIRDKNKIDFSKISQDTSRDFIFKAEYFMNRWNNEHLKGS